MSIQGILAKEYMPDLSLVGSHVAALQPLAYTASTSKCCSAFGSINQRHAILPGISRISRSPEQKLAHRSLSEYSSTHSLIGSIEMPPGGLDTLFQSTQRLVSSPPHDPNTCPNEELADKGTEPSVQPQCWRSSKSSPDDSLLSQAMKLEQFNLSSQQPNHILHSLPNQKMPPHQVNVIHSDGSERRSTWHAELLTESNKKTSKDELAEEQNKELQNENNNSNRTSSTKNKHKKGKRKKKKKSHRSASNKANWAKVRSKSAGRPWQPLSGKASATGSNHDDNNGPMIMAHCKAISVLPLPRHLSKPNVIAPLGNRVNHQATPRSHRSTMGTMASVPMSGKSNLHPGHVRVMMPKSVEGLWPGGMKSDMTSVENVRRVVKVFCSDKHSGMLKELGMEVPCAPPATPTPAMLSKFEYIPSMNDVRSQRAVKIRLETLEKLEKKKQEKLKIEKSRQEKQEMKEKEKELKKRQRLEIYALNKVMTEFENANFEEFCKKHGLNLK